MRAKRSGTFVSSIAYKGVVVVLGAVTSILISRALLPQGRGSYYVFVSLATLTISLGHLSVEHAQAFLWSEGADPDALRANSVLLGVAVGTVSALATWVIVFLLGPSIVPISSPYLLWLALLAVPIGSVALYASGLLYLSERLLIVNAASAVAAAVQCASVVVLWSLSRLTVATVLAIWVASFALPLLVILPILRPRFRQIDWRLLSRTIKVGLRYHLGMASLFLLLRLDTLLLNGMSSKTQVGLYSLAVTLAEMVYLLTDTIAQLVLPRQMSGSLDQCADYTSSAVGMNIVLATAAFALLAAVSPWAIPSLYGTAFRGSVPMLLWLGPGVVALAIARPAGAMLLRFNRPLRVSMLAMAATACNVGVNVLLIPRYGGVGASVASSIAYVLLAGAHLAWLRHATGRSWGAFRPRPAQVARLALARRVVEGPSEPSLDAASDVETVTRLS